MNLVTGANGLLGSRLVYDLARVGRPVRAMIRRGADLHILKSYFRDHDTLYRNIEWIEGDILDIFSIEEALQQVSMVYHCAAKVSFNPEDYDQMMQVNIKGTANMVNACMDAGVQKFCHASSVAAIGRSLDGETITEETVWKTSKFNSNYAISKYGAEREVWRAVAEGLDAVVVNPVIILGRGNWEEGSSSLVKKVYDGLKFYTKGINGFVDVADVSNSMIRLMDSTIKNERFILQAENLSYFELFNLAAGFLKKPPPVYQAGPVLSSLAWRLEKLKSMVTRGKPLITKETARTANSRHYYSNIKIKQKLGFEFMPVKESLEKLCRDFLADQP